MQIAALVRCLYPSGGAEQSMCYLCEQLSSVHNVTIYGYSMEQDAKTNNISGCTITKQQPKSNSNLPKPRLLNDFCLATGFVKNILLNSPDIIIAQHEHILTASYVGNILDIPVVCFIRDNSHLDYITPRDLPPGIRELNQSLLQIDLRWHKSSLKRADILISNSNFTSKLYKQKLGVGSSVVYPFIEEDKYKSTSTGNKILHVNPKKKKGVDITLSVAESMEKEEFIIVGTAPQNNHIENRINELPNVEYIGYVDNMGEVYEDVKIALYPSRWHEPFGRVPVEAGINGIPTITSGKGGLKESTPHETLIVNENTPEEYIKKIRAVNSEYDRLSEEVEQKSKQLTAPRQLAKFSKIISNKLELDEDIL